MAYTINKTDGTVVATIQDGTTDNTTSLLLIGRNYQGYGEIIAENLVKLLENSASGTAPSSPMTGELWFDTITSNIKVYDGTNFEYPHAVRTGTSAPTKSIQTGTLWYDTANNLFKVYTGSAFVSLGPITILDEDAMTSNSASAVATQQSIKAYVDAQIVASNTLNVRDDASGNIEVNFVDGFYVRGANSLTTTVDTDDVNLEKRLTIALDSDIYVNSISSADSTTVRVNDALEVDSLKSNGTLVAGTTTLGATTTGTLGAGASTLSSLTLASGSTVTAVLDEDTLTSDSDTALATQQSIKAYVDSATSGISTNAITQSNSNVTVTDSGTGSITVTADGGLVATLNATDISFTKLTKIETDDGLQIGVDNDVTLTQNGADFTLKNTTEDGNMYFNVNVGGVDTTAMTIQGSTSTITVAQDLSVVGNLTVSGTTTQVNTTNTTIEDSLIVLNQGISNTASTYDSGLLIERGTLTNVAMIWDESLDEFAYINTTETGNTAGNVTISSYADIHYNEATGTAIQAFYADLAERYESDQPLEPGDVVKIGGEKEITKTSGYNDDEVFGVVSTNPALKMNAEAGDDSTHPYIALSGRVPCKVVGEVIKGQRLISSEHPGVAVAAPQDWKDTIHNCAIIGRALENKTHDGIGQIEIVVGRN